jgi:DNA-binding transcriptional regulator YiaG
MTQRDFSFYLQVATNTVSAWENGHATPSPLAERAIRDLCAREDLDLHTMQSFSA